MASWDHLYRQATHNRGPFLQNIVRAVYDNTGQLTGRARERERARDVAEKLRMTSHTVLVQTKIS